MKILIAVDGSPSSLRAVEYVTRHADIFGASAEITLIAVHLPMPSPRVRSLVGKEVLDEYYSDESDEALAAALAHLRDKGRSFATLKRVGDPGQEIATAAADGFQMIIMGTHGRTALGNLVMGSVAMRVLAESSVSVLLVK